MKRYSKGVALPEETSAALVEEAIPQRRGMTPASTPKGGAVMRATKEPAMEKRGPKFLGWEKVLHPSQPVVAARQIPHPSRGPRLREEQVVQNPQTKPSRTPATLQKTPTPQKPSLLVQELEVVQPVTPTSGFLGVMACLRRDESLERAPKVSPNPLAIGVMTSTRVATMSMSHIVRDEATGVTYMDTVTTSIWRVALSGPEQETPSQGPTIEGCNRPCLKGNLITTFGQWDKPATTVKQMNLWMTAIGQKNHGTIGW